MKTYKFRNEQYRFNFKIHSGTREELVQLMKKKDLSEFKPRTTARMLYVESEQRIELFFVKSVASAGTVAHEALHAIHFIYESIGQGLDYSDDEHMCYLHGWLVNKIYSNL